MGCVLLLKITYKLFLVRDGMGSLPLERKLKGVEKKESSRRVVKRLQMKITYEHEVLREERKKLPSQQKSPPPIAKTPLQGRGGSTAFEFSTTSEIK